MLERQGKNNFKSYLNLTLLSNSLCIIIKNNYYINTIYYNNLDFCYSI